MQSYSLNLEHLKLQRCQRNDRELKAGEIKNSSETSSPNPSARAPSASVMEQEEAAAQEEAGSQLMYRIERPVYDEVFIRSQLLHRKEKSTTVRQRLAQQFR